MGLGGNLHIIIFYIFHVQNNKTLKGLRIVEERLQTQILCKQKEHLFCRNSQHAGVDHPHKMAMTPWTKALFTGTWGILSVMK